MFEIQRETREYFCSLRRFCKNNYVIQTPSFKIEDYIIHFSKKLNSVFYVVKNPVPYEPIKILEKYEKRIVTSFFAVNGIFSFLIQLDESFHVIIGVTTSFDGKFNAMCTADCYFVKTTQFLDFMEENKDLEITEVKINKIGLV